MTADQLSPTPERPPVPTAYRWLVLVIISLAMFGNYYAYDCIAPLADVLKAQLGYSDKIIGLLNGIYSFPNIVMVLIGGVIIDRIGTRRGTLLFGTLCFLGAVLTAVSGNWMVMVAGRLLFGLGRRVPHRGGHHGHGQVVPGQGALLRLRDQPHDRPPRLLRRAALPRAGPSPPTSTGSGPSSSPWPSPPSASPAPSSTSLLERRAENRYALAKEGETDKVVWGDLFKMSPSYWYMVALCVTFYSAIFPFQTFAVKFFMEAHGATRESGGQLLAMLTLFAMICHPHSSGSWWTRSGKRALFMMFGSLLLIPVYLMMGYTRSLSLFLPMAMMGIAYSLIPAIMWPSVAYIVEQKKLGTAYGLMTIIQNVGLFAFNVLVGWSNDHWNASAANPGGYHAGHVDLLLPGLLRAPLLLPAAAQRDGAPRPRPRDHHGADAGFPGRRGRGRIRSRALENNLTRIQTKSPLVFKGALLLE